MNDTHYFNLHVSGIGYLNRIREVTPKKGEPFLCCDIAALRGEASEAEHTWFDCRVSGRDAQILVRRCLDACEQKRKVLVQFRLGDLYAETFTFSKGERKGETGVSLKAHLLWIGLIKIDGEEVYKAESKPVSSETQPASRIQPERESQY
ncbi:STY4534 family ICE replication protein [Dryocola clanedunensis]